MTDNVVPIGGATRLAIPPERVLKAALEDFEFMEVVIIGYLSDGSEYFAASEPNGDGVVWHLERAKFKLMVIADADTD